MSEYIKKIMLPCADGSTREIDAQDERRMSAVEARISEAVARVAWLENERQEAVADKYFQMWLAVRGTNNVIVKVRAGGKVTYCFDGLYHDVGYHHYVPDNPVVKYAHPLFDTYIHIEVPNKENALKGKWLLGLGGSYMWDTNNEDVVELCAIDINETDETDIRIRSADFPFPNLYYMGWDLSNCSEINTGFINSGIQGIIDLRNWDMTNCTRLSQFPQQCTKILFPFGRLTDPEQKRIYLNGIFNENMIDGCTEPSIEDWYAPNVLSYMMFNRYGGKRLNLSKWITGSITNRSTLEIFSYCPNLEWVDISNFDTGGIIHAEVDYPSSTGYDYSVVVRACPELRWIELGPAYFKYNRISFWFAPALGFNKDGSDNGWLQHLVTVLPTIRKKDKFTELLENEEGIWYLNDGKRRLIRPYTTLKNATWAQPLIAEMQAKGWTIV